jgi:hypothetical protein
MNIGIRLQKSIALLLTLMMLLSLLTGCGQGSGKNDAPEKAGGASASTGRGIQPNRL